MRDVVRMPSVKLNELFALTAEQMSMPPGIVEKDFWVVWTLDYLFARSPTFRFSMPLSPSSASSTAAAGRITSWRRRRRYRSCRPNMHELRWKPTIGICRT